MPVVECDTYHVDGYAIDNMNQYAGFEDVPYVTAAAAYEEERGILHVFVINGDWEEEHDFTMDIRGFGDYKLEEQLVMAEDFHEKRNSFEEPDLHRPRPAQDARMEKGVLKTVLKKLSWNVFRFQKI